MTAGILKEQIGENRVSLLPDQAEILSKKGVQVLIEKDAGNNAFLQNETYRSKNVGLSSRQEILTNCDIIFSINLPSKEDISLIKQHTVIVGIFQPLYHFNTIQYLADKEITTFSLDMLPRTTRAQTMDVLSSQANIAGYKAVLLAAANFSGYFPMFMTAAGSIPPAKVLILGAGVAGLQAVATARRLGAVVEVFDTRPAVKEEVMSLGAKFIEVEGAADASKAGGYAVEQSGDYKQKQHQKILEAASKADIIITTAQIPGKAAPLLITDDILAAIKPRSIIVDLAAATGGNTAITKNEETIIYNGITVIGAGNLASTIPYDASRLYGKNVLNFLQLLFNKTGDLHLNFEDDLVKGCCITHAGNIINERVLALAKAPA
ncbi:Re/Si-specific NAD(P)(+) transhydrogenase subunit alpha [Chitinophagaceae bacterium LWZ2-11]